MMMLQDLIQKLLERKPAKRLGMLSGKAQDVKRHRWFEGMDWAALEARRSAPSRRPKVRCLPASLVWTLYHSSTAAQQNNYLCCSKLVSQQTVLAGHRYHMHAYAAEPMSRCTKC
jgi:serine/threonine protein kinase